MKRLMMLAVAALVALGAWADTFDTWTDPKTGYRWTYRICGEEVEITTDREVDAISPEPRGAVVIPSTLGGKPVTSVGYWAFAGCIGLTGVTLPNSLTNIGEHAFDYTGLKSVTIPNGVTNIGDNAFVSCGMLQNVEIGHGVVNIGNEAFLCCSNLTSLSIGSRVTRIGWHTFEGCRNLMAVTIPDSVTSIDSSAFSGCSKMTSLILGNRVTYIGGSAFSGCSCLASVTIPDSVTSLASSAFSGCNSSLFDTTTIPGVKLVDGWVVGNTVPLPSNLDLTGVRGIADQSFYGCTGLVRVTIPNGVTRIGSYAFAGCSGLTDVVMPNSLTSIGNAAFFDCSSLTSVTIPGSVKSIEANVFNCCSNLTSVTVPASVTNIGLYAFSHCSRLGAIAVEQGNMVYRSDNGLLLTKDGKSLVAVPGGLAEVDIPDGVERIGKYAFYECIGLTDVTIPASVTNIGDHAFEGCVGLSRVMIPNGVKRIGVSTFYMCNGLSNIVFVGNAPSLGPNAFSKVSPNCCAYVRRSSTFWGVEIPGTWNGIAIDYLSDAVASPQITSVVAKQRWPWNGLVDIACNVSEIDDMDSGLKFDVSAVDADSGNAYNVSHFWVVQDGTNSTDCVVHTNGDYRFVWDAQADLGQVIYSNMLVRVSLKKDDVHQKVQLWEGGPYWATTNIGAGEPWEYGYYFWWGDTVGYRREGDVFVANDSFSFILANTPTGNKGLATLRNDGWITADNVLARAHDASYILWGEGWRMPTYRESYDLYYNKCDWIWTTTNNVNGYIVRGRGDYASHSIFLPCAGAGSGTSLNNEGSFGYYWLSDPYPDGRDYSYALSFSAAHNNASYYAREKGFSIRPVQEFTESAAIIVQAGESAPFLLDTMDGPRIARDVETIAYSARWNGTTDANADVSVTLNGEPFVSGKGEGVAQWTPTSAGTYTFQHMTAGSDETLTAIFNVVAKDVALSQVAVDCRDVTYSGSAFKPPIQSVIWGEKALVESTDYTFSYSDNVNVGTATITLTGTNFYDGTYTTNFTIRPKPLTQGMVEAIGNHPYTGKAQTPKPTVIDAERGVTLSEDVEYTLSYANNTAIGEGIVTVTGKGNYTGSIARAFVIEPSVGSDLEERIGGAGKVESDDVGGWIVTLTNDVDAADLPIKIPDDFGSVTIDLNGHNLVGTDGEPAIRIVQGGGEGLPTVLSVITTGGYAVVQGGEGAPAVEVADGTQEGVSFNFGAGVIVRSGLKPEIRDVTAKQRYPWNGKVDITCTVSGIDGTSDGFRFALAAVDTDSGTTNKVLHFWVVQNGTNSTDYAVHTNGDYRFVWDARADLGHVIYSNMLARVSIGKEDVRQKVQLWEGGPYWATTNIGAEKPEDYGYYFWWGDTIGYKRENDKWVATDGSSSAFSFESINAISGQTYGKSIGDLQSQGWITADSTLVPEHDAAHVHWGGVWRMPTDQELSDLKSKCNWTLTTTNGVQGWIVSGKGAYASGSIFLPCAGCGSGISLYDAGSNGYDWSSVPDTVSGYAWGFYFDSSGNGMYRSDRFSGRSVRPVQGFTESAVIIVQAGESASFLLDTSDAPRESEGIETLTYSSLWAGNADATVTIAQDGVVLAERLTGEGEWVWNVTRNGTYVLTHTTYTNGIAGNVETATFVVTGQDVPFADRDVVVTGYSGVYDGTAHGINVSVAGGIVGAVVRYATGDEAPSLPWADVSPTLTNVGSMTVWCEISAPGYVTQTNSATITIEKRPVTVDVIGETATYAYDGKMKYVDFFNLTTDDELYEPLNKTYFAGFCHAQRTDVGKTYMEILPMYFANGDGNFDVTYAVTDGWLCITQATNEWVVVPSMAGWTCGQTPSEPDMGTAKFGTATVTYSGVGGALGSARPTEPGEYVAVFAVAETANWSGLTQEVPFKITAAERVKLEDAFDGKPVTIESDGEGGWIVTITNDIDAADLPIEIPDNIGNVTIDLNGHDLVGGDGQPVVKIVAGEGDGNPTQIAIVNSGEDATVQGGEGAPAIEVADGAQDGVLINIGEGVTVQGGDDYTPAIIGEIGTNEGLIVEPVRIHIPGEGTVTVPKSWKTDQKVTWKAVAAKGSVFAHWEGAFVDSRLLSKNELRNPSLVFAVPAGFDTNGIRAVFIAVDDDRLGQLALSQPGPLAPNVEVAGLSLVDDSGSYVTASMSGLPTGLKFDAKTLVITGKPTKPGVYTVKITAKNASGYQWAENIELRVADIEDARIGFGGLPAEGAVGTAYAGQIAAGEFKSLSASGLPAGLKMDAKTGAVGGVPTKGGYFTVTVTANYPDRTKATATRLLTISPVAAVAEPKRTAYHPLTVLSTNVATGTATGTGVYAAGKKVSISAKPAKGWVFAGWYRDMKLAVPMAFASADGRTASQSVTVPEVRYLFARFATEAEDAASLKVAVADAVTETDGTYALDLGACVESLSLPKLAVTGLPAGLKYDAKTLKITGKATKPGVYMVKVAATNTSVKKATDGTTATFTITVPNFTCGALPGLLSETDAYGAIYAGVALDPDLIDCTPADGWTVKVAGLPTGLKYDAKTGRIDGVPTAKAGAYTVTFTASKKGEANQVATITLNVEALPAWAVGSFDGVAYPSGLTATSPASGEESHGVVTLTVDAKGKISGKLLEGGQTWTLSAGAYQRVEGQNLGKLDELGNLENLETLENPVFHASVVGKSGKLAITNEVTVAAYPSGLAATSPASGEELIPYGGVSGGEWMAWQNLWKRADTKAAMPVIQKDIKVDHWLDEQDDKNNMVTLTFKKDGVVAFAGMVGGVKVSGSSQLVSVGRDDPIAPYQITFYAPPKATAKPPFEGWCETLTVTLTTNEQDVVTGVVVTQFVK